MFTSNEGAVLSNGPVPVVGSVSTNNDSGNRTAFGFDAQNIIAKGPVAELADGSDHAVGVAPPAPDDKQQRLDATIDSSPPAANVGRRRQRKDGRPERDRRHAELRAQTWAEVDAVLREHHERLPRSQAKSVGAAYMRYSTRHQDSIADQLREILLHAERLGVFVPRELVFFDLAVRGCTGSREGLDALRTSLKRREAQVVLFFSTSRLFRKQYRTLAFVDEVHKDLGVRCVFVKSAIDTDDKQRYEALLTMHSLIDQHSVTMNVANIQAAHQGLMEKRIVFGSLPYGYTGQAIEGQFTKRNRPRRTIVPDPVTAHIVKQIFDWYVQDRLSQAEILRRLNDDETIPLPPHGTAGEWTDASLFYLLTNERYRGLWKYGVREAVYLPTKDYTRQTLRVEPLKECHIEDLRLVSNEMWYAAQSRMGTEATLRGRRAKRPDRKSRPKLLNGLMYCPVHDRPLYVGGVNGKLMQCPSCRRTAKPDRPLFSYVNRRLAVARICGKLVELLTADEQMVAAIEQACRVEIELLQQPDPTRLKALQLDDERLKRAISLTRRTAGNSQEEQSEAEQEIKNLQAERRVIQADIVKLEANMRQRPAQPSRQEIKDLLANLASILRDVTAAETDENWQLARDVIELLIDGRIEMHQMGERKAQHGWLQARFKVGILKGVQSRLTGSKPVNDFDSMEVHVDLRRETPVDPREEQAWSMRQAGSLSVEIGKALGVGKTMVLKLLRRAAAKRGVTLDDGRARRGQLAVKQQAPRKHVQIAEEVKRLADEGVLFDEIARSLGTNRDQVTRAWVHWHTSRGLPAPDGRARRKQLTLKSRPRQAKPSASDNDAAT